MERRTKRQSNVQEIRSVKPWHSFAPLYYKAGWIPLPLPARKKASPPTGSTGKYPMPDAKMLKTWFTEYNPRGNIAIRVPDDVIGIDVDAYDKKVGARSLGVLEEELGALPATWTLTARADGVSGIRFFRVPPGLHWAGEPIDDVQIVQFHHRYAVAYPSVHPDTKKVYRWYPPGGLLNGAPLVTVEHEIPSKSELPELPLGWVEALTGGRVWKERAADLDAGAGDLLEWIEARPDADGDPCRAMERQLNGVIEDFSVGGSHDALNSGIYALVSLASEGHCGLSSALSALEAAFAAEVTAAGRSGRRTAKGARDEFLRARDGAVRIMLGSLRDGESILEEDCGCRNSSLAWGEKLGIGVTVEEGPDSGALGRRRSRLGRAMPADKYTMDDSGNAEHLLDALDGNAAYIPGMKCWSFWNPKIGSWENDLEGGRITQAAQIVGKRQRELATEYNEKLIAGGSSLKKDVGGEFAARIAALVRHSKVSSNYQGLRNMARIAECQDRAVVVAEAFDADPRLLACLNGTLVLDPVAGLSFRPARREDRCAANTRTEFVPGAGSRAGRLVWSRYLRLFLPDRAVRDWLQKLIGYCLIGGNPDRLMVFLQGLTSTGKTTFVNAITAMLGDYAGTLNLSLFRDNQDERPRADLVHALGKRVLTASEASAAWVLHGDQIKRLTGRDPIKARLLYSSTFVERVPAFTPLVATNTMPMVTGADLALKRRLVRVPFGKVVSLAEENTAAGDALLSPSGRSAVLAWAVAGWEKYAAAGSGGSAGGGLRDMPDAVIVATAEMAAEMSDLDSFLAECYDLVPRGWVTSNAVWEKWKIWCMENEVKHGGGLSRVMFGRELNGRGYTNTVRKVDGKSERVWVGLAESSGDLR